MYIDCLNFIQYLDLVSDVYKPTLQFVIDKSQLTPGTFSLAQAHQASDICCDEKAPLCTAVVDLYECLCRFDVNKEVEDMTDLEDDLDNITIR